MNTTKNTTNLKFGLAICGLLAVADVAGLAATGVDDAPPVAVIAIGAVLGVITLGALRYAWRQVPGGLWAVIASRAVSAPFALPPFFIDVPTYIRVGCAVTIVLAVLGIGLVLPYARRSQRAEVRTA